MQTSLQLLKPRVQMQIDKAIMLKHRETFRNFKVHKCKQESKSANLWRTEGGSQGFFHLYDEESKDGERAS